MKTVRRILFATLLSLATVSTAFAGNIPTGKDGNIPTGIAGNIPTGVVDVALSLLSFVY
ncbi:MAG TPA: hypothetical protein VE135_04340 [Pyrinomonadaceae bacterium]|nr:hypothetical protein [Pyrinomonadaceae bacterium]